MTPGQHATSTRRRFGAASFACEIETDDDEVDRRIARALDLLATTSSGPVDARYALRTTDHGFSLTTGGHRVNTAEQPQSLIDFVIGEVTRQTTTTAGTTMCLHAGVVQSTDAGVVVLPGMPDAGKSTLTAGLVHAGLRYLSDEVGLVERSSGTVHPFPRALWLSRASLRLLPRVDEALPDEARGFDDDINHVLPADLGGAAGAAGRVSHVIFPTYVPDAPVELTELNRAEALTRLAECVFDMRRHGGAGLQGLRRMVGDAPCYRLVSGSLDGSVSAVHSLL